MLFCQLDYPQELGTKDPFAEPITIAMAGCALCSVASLLANVFQLDVDLLSLNQQLIDVTGYASNGAGDVDLIDWSAITRIFPDIPVLFNKTYYNPPAEPGDPADMQLIDKQLADGFSVIVGVSFNHNPKETYPTHYVELYRKNSDGTYQCRDSMYREAEADTVFDKRYAVNGMSVANCILQAVSYTGILPKKPIVSDNLNIPLVLTADQVMKDKAASASASISPSASVSPSLPPVDPLTDPSMTVDPATKIEQLTQEKNDLVTKLQAANDKYKIDLASYQGLLAAGYEKVEDVLKYVEEVEKDNAGLTLHIKEVLDDNSVYLQRLADQAKKDATAIDVGQKYEKLYKDMKSDLSAIAYVFRTKPSITSILSAAERIKRAYDLVVKQLRKQDIKQAAQAAEAVAESPVVQKEAMNIWNKLFGLTNQKEVSKT